MATKATNAPLTATANYNISDIKQFLIKYYLETVDDFFEIQ